MKIYCKNIEQYIPFKGGVTLAQIAENIPLDFRPICARVNNKTEDLAFPVYSPKHIEYLPINTATGQRVYVRSLCMILYRAVVNILPEAILRIEHSVSRGYYCRLFNRAENVEIHVDQQLIDRILDRMRDLVARDIPFERHERLTKDVIEIFRRQNLDDKVSLLTSISDLYTTYYTLDGISDSYYGPLAPSTGCISTFDIRPFHGGFLLLAFDMAQPDMPASPVTQQKMFDVFTRYQDFNKVIKVSNVGDLNHAVMHRESSRLINVAEAIHNKYISNLSDRIAALHNDGKARIVLIAGPSSSGKTTFCKRLAIQLMTNLLSPKMISLDDYFVDRQHTPLDESGDYDFESLYALDLERLNADLSALLRGEEINLPTYSFELGERVERHRPLKLDHDDILIIEGIHGLNPELTRHLDSSKIFKIYVSALTTLHIDDHNWISTTDNRLLRRIVRDHKYRHTSAVDTIRRWPSVRRGEEKWIFPYQENADATFNSSLIFEIAVMKEYAEPLLRQVPHDVPEYGQAYRLLKFLSYFHPVPADQIPFTSLLREFLGGSSFHY